MTPAGTHADPAPAHHRPARGTADGVEPFRGGGLQLTPVTAGCGVDPRPHRGAPLTKLFGSEDRRPGERDGKGARLARVNGNGMTRSGLLEIGSP